MVLVGPSLPFRYKWRYQLGTRLGLFRRYNASRRALTLFFLLSHNLTYRCRCTRSARVGVVSHRTCSSAVKWAGRPSFIWITDTVGVSLLQKLPGGISNVGKAPRRGGVRQSWQYRVSCWSLIAGELRLIGWLATAVREKVSNLGSIHLFTRCG